MDKQAIVYLFALFIISFVTRVGPLLIGNWLKKQAWMQRISLYLPCMILTLLLFHELAGKMFGKHPQILAPLIGVGVTLLIHLWKRQAIVSIIAGVIAFTTASWLL